MTNTAHSSAKAGPATMQAWRIIFTPVAPLPEHSPPTYRPLTHPHTLPPDSVAHQQLEGVDRRDLVSHADLFLVSEEHEQTEGQTDEQTQYLNYLDAEESLLDADQPCLQGSLEEANTVGWGVFVAGGGVLLVGAACSPCAVDPPKEPIDGAHVNNFNGERDPHDLRNHRAKVELVCRSNRLSQDAWLSPLSPISHHRQGVA